MLVYSLVPIRLKDLYTSCPAFLKNEALIKNQAYYSMINFKKESSSRTDAMLLRPMAKCVGSVSDVQNICSLLQYLNLDYAVETAIGSCYTKESIVDLRRRYHERLKFINRYRGR
jgi:hypothetical protein